MGDLRDTKRPRPKMRIEEVHNPHVAVVENHMLVVQLGDKNDREVFYDANDLADLIVEKLVTFLNDANKN